MGLAKDGLVGLDRCDAGVRVCWSVQKAVHMVYVVLPIKVHVVAVVGAVVLIVLCGVIHRHLVLTHASLVEGLRRNVRICVHAQEESQVEHPLALFHIEEIAHVFNKFALELITTLFVPAHRVAFLRQYRHVITAFLKAEARQLND